MKFPGFSLGNRHISNLLNLGNRPKQVLTTDEIKEEILKRYSVVQRKVTKTKAIRKYLKEGEIVRDSSLL